MAINKQKTLSINGTVIGYEGNVKIKDGSTKRMPHGIKDSPVLYTSSVEEAYSTITITMRVTENNNSQFDSFFDLEDNILITYGAKAFRNCVMEEKPEREDLQTVDYVFFGQPGS